MKYIEDAETYAKKIADSIPIGTNITYGLINKLVLEAYYEGRRDAMWEIMEEKMKQRNRDAGRK